MKRLCALALLALLASCAPALQEAGRPGASFAGPRLGRRAFVSFDGARLGLTQWDAVGGPPWAVIIGLHGMNDYAHAFHMAGSYWASQGITTIAYDMRGFGRSPNRGVWAPDDLNIEDLRTIVALARREYPGAVIAVAGESLGGAVAIEAFASARPPAADRLILLSPAVWGWSTQPVAYKALLWLVAHAAPGEVITPPRWLSGRIWASDNRAELFAMGRDPLMIWGARSDALYGLVTTMQRAFLDIDEVRGPTLYLYGAHDEIIPKRPAYQAAARLPADDRTAFYAKGWHLLLRDRQAANVWRDVVAFIRDPRGDLPSGAPPIPGRRIRPPAVAARAARAGVVGRPGPA
ncbi:MAG: alpha/beta fold hydrolase [Caulobacteraceae bacterium]